MYRENSALWNQIEGNWKQLRGEAQKAWGWLTDDDFDQIEGRRDVLSGKVQEYYGITQEEADRRLDEWADALEW